jgi:hypothetical protein
MRNLRKAGHPLQEVIWTRVLNLLILRQLAMVGDDGSYTKPKRFPLLGIYIG